MHLLAICFATNLGLVLLGCSALYIGLSETLRLYSDFFSPFPYLLLSIVFLTEKNFQTFFTRRQKHISKNPEEDIVYAQDVFTFKQSEPVFRTRDFDESSMRDYLETAKRQKAQEKKDGPGKPPYTRPRREDRIYR